MCIAFFHTNLHAQTHIGIPFDPLKLLPKSKVTDTIVSHRKIEIIHSDFLEQETDTITQIIKRKLDGHVRLKHEEAFMNCDSAILFPNSNYLEAQGKVKITKGDSIEIRSGLLKYNGDSKIAILEQNVILKDKTSTLSAPMMTYEIDKDIGHFWNDGQLISDSTTLTSNNGTYFQHEGYTVFRENVVLKSPDYIMFADSMKYDNDSKIAYFISETTIISDKDTIITRDGYFDSKKNKAYLKGRPLIKNGIDNTLQADFLDYDKNKGEGFAQGNIISRNIKEKATLLSNQIYYTDSLKYTLATSNPLMIHEDEKDTLFLSADTLINYTINKEKFLTQSLHSPSLDTAKTPLDTTNVNMNITVKDKQKKKDTVDNDTIKTNNMSILQENENIENTDSIVPSLDSIKIFYGYKNVKFIRSQLSGICDSIYFNSMDSIFKLYYHPILWIDSTQLLSDSIYIYMKNGKADKIELFDNAIIIKESDPNVYHQIAGKKITGWLLDNKIQHVLVNGNAECIYFLKNDSSEYIGGNLAKGAFINISFNNNNEIQRLKIELSPEATFTPIQQIQLNTYFLNNFKWHWTSKPKDKWDVIRDTVQYQKFLLEHPVQKDSLSSTSDTARPPIEDSLQNIDTFKESDSKKSSFIKKEPNLPIIPTEPSSDKPIRNKGIRLKN
ncbi:MAG: hypothetical protein LC105_06450 [Chitinophagales bacterium]|nr:hypothetical protein [Chitinophagales bacterium]MCZ2393476.1 hypothetical protein [Chitinophagales bacterium]